MRYLFSWKGGFQLSNGLLEAAVFLLLQMSVYGMFLIWKKRFKELARSDYIFTCWCAAAFGVETFLAASSPRLWATAAETAALSPPLPVGGGGSGLCGGGPGGVPSIPGWETRCKRGGRWGGPGSGGGAWSSFLDPFRSRGGGGCGCYNQVWWMTEL